MDFLLEIGVFAGKAFFIVASIVFVLVVLFSLISKQQIASSKKLVIENLSQKYAHYRDQLCAETDPSGQRIKQIKKQKKALKKLQKKKKLDESRKAKTFVIEFEGDLKASHVKSLREEVTAILTSADPSRDDVCLLLESTGGMVHSYGLAAAQLLRLKNSGLPLTICVDKVAASGGYMMACIADRLLCSPFAILGSIGVVAQVPNLHKFLQKNSIDYEEMTAGEYKRTVSFLAEITPKGKEKFLQQLDETHGLFKDFVQRNRKSLDIAKVATGEYWYGLQAKDLQLVDEIQTSDEYLFSIFETRDIYKVSVQTRKNLSEKIAEAVSLSAEATTNKFLQKNQDTLVSQT